MLIAIDDLPDGMLIAIDGLPDGMLIAIDGLPDGMLIAIDGLPGCPGCVEGALHACALRASLGMSLEFHASPCLEPRPFFPSSHATVY